MAKEALMFHHALCVTDDGPAVAAALAAISPVAIRAILGDDSARIEIAPLPPELDGRLTPGTTAISLAVDNLGERVATCRAAGLDVSVGVEGGDLAFAVVSVGGVEFELVQC